MLVLLSAKVDCEADPNSEISVGPLAGVGKRLSFSGVSGNSIFFRTWQLWAPVMK